MKIRKTNQFDFGLLAEGIKRMKNRKIKRLLYILSLIFQEYMF